MVHFAPSILSANFAHLQQDIEAVEKGGCDYLHFDVMDGVFVPSISFGLPVLKCIKPVTNLFMDVHLMIVEPEKYIDEFASSGADMISFHYEATKDSQAVIDQIHGHGIKCGIVISPDTPAEAIKPYLDKVESVMVMTVYPGFGGQKLMESCVDKIRVISGWAKEAGLDIGIEIDGGVNKDNVSRIIDAGANIIVAGSAVFKNDIEKNTREFLEIINNK